MGYSEFDGLEQGSPPTDGATGQDAIGYLRVLPIDKILPLALQAADRNPDTQRDTETK